MKKVIRIGQREFKRDYPLMPFEMMIWDGRYDVWVSINDEECDDMIVDPNSKLWTCSGGATSDALKEFRFEALLYAHEEYLIDEYIECIATQQVWSTGLSCTRMQN